jgi:hypothetical protein
MKQHLKWATLVATTIGIFMMMLACNQENDLEVLTGQLIGHVSLSNQYTPQTDHSGIEVVIEGTDPLRSVTTNTDGKFVVDNLECGTYNFVFKKEGYCTHKIVGHQFVGGNTPSAVKPSYLFPIINIKIDSLKARATPYSLQKNSLHLTATIIQEQNISQLYFRYFLSSDPNVSYKNFNQTETAWTRTNTNQISSFCNLDPLTFPTGTPIYVIVYPVAETLQYYFDINTGLQIFSSVNVNKPSEVVSVVMPELFP